MRQIIRIFTLCIFAIIASMLLASCAGIGFSYGSSESSGSSGGFTSSGGHFSGGGFGGVGFMAF